MPAWRELIPFVVHPIRTARYVASRFVYPHVLRLLPGVTLRGALDVREFPSISVAAGGRLVLGSGVKLNSRNEGYHVNMHSPVKLIVGRAGARIEIGDGTRVHGTCIHALELIRIGRNCLIAANTQIIDSNGHELSLDDPPRRIHTTGRPRPVTIGDNVWIGANCIILPGVTIGDGSVVAAGSVLSDSVPSNVVASGNPAQVRRSRDPNRDIVGAR